MNGSHLSNVKNISNSKDIKNSLHFRKRIKVENLYQVNKLSHSLHSRYAIIGVLLVVLVVLYPTLSNEWVNWDDPSYVLDNPLVKSLSRENINTVFHTSQVMGIYHPFTILSLALDYHFWGTDPYGYHLTNLVIHLLNTLLIYFICKRILNSVAISLITALLFGMHPMHVESVAWVSARKDVLYVFFLLISWLFYLVASGKVRRKIFWYLGSLLFFVSAVLSKSIAFVFPFILILSGFMKTGAIPSKKELLRTIPFFVIAGLAMFSAFSGQSETSSIEISQDYSLVHSGFFGSYNIVYYAFKSIVPFQLAAFHPFPFSDQGYELSLIHYLAILPIIGLIALLYLSWRNDKRIFAGLAFFMVTILPLIQIIPFGKALSSERYTYLPYVGVFIVIGLLAKQISMAKPKFAKWIISLLGVWLIFLGIQSWNQTKSWKNSETLWTQVIETHPDAFYAYYSRGMYYTSINKYDLALEDFNESIHYFPTGLAYYERGLANEKIGELGQAKQDYLDAINLDIDYPLAHLNLGVLLGKEGDLKKAIDQFEMAIEIDDTYTLAYFNCATVYKMTGNSEKALAYYSKAIQLDEKNADYHIRRGVLYIELGKPADALTDFKSALTIDSDSGEIHYLLAVTYWQLGQKDTSRIHAKKAIDYQFNLPNDFRAVVGL